MSKNGIYIGTSGYSYKDWLGNFYPQFCPSADFLRFYATIFNTVEIDSTYYRIPRKDSITKWYKTTPDNFIFSAKFPASVTHEGDIKTRVDNAEAFIDVMRRLENKLGPLLLQFPYGFKPDESFEIMEKLVSIMPKDLKIAVEVRNKKWLKSDFYDLLRSRNITLALVDHPWMPRMTEYTGGFAYIRLLGDRDKIDSDFSYIRDDREEDLKWWSHLSEEYSRDQGEVYAYLNNHYSGHSPSSARRLMELLSTTSA
ncbi:MAG: DUF72 domain-containing protein [Candidatus Zixiibacteriota bacterium]